MASRVSELLGLGRNTTLGRQLRAAARRLSIYRPCTPVMHCELPEVQILLHPRFARQWRPEYEQQVVCWLRTHGELFDCFFDIGAYVGVFSIIVAKTLGIPVFAFEPLPENQFWIRHHVRANRVADQVTLFPCALGEKDGYGLLFNSMDSSQASLRNLGPESPGTETPVRSLDSVIEELGGRASRRLLAKIDVEGAELLVLRGAAKTLAAFRPTLLMELHPYAYPSFGYDVENILDLLTDCAYELRDLSGNSPRQIPQHPSHWLATASCTGKFLSFRKNV